MSGAAAEPAKRPRFSIVVPAYQAASTLAETLDAIAAQACPDWECVVVDDGSTDRTPAIASEYVARDRRFRLVGQANQGTAAAYNTGVAAAVGDFMVICSADDILLPEHLADMSAFIDAEPDYDIYSTNGYFWWPDGRREPFYGPGEYPEATSLRLSDVIRRCFFGVGATYRRQVHAKVGGYRRGVFGEDYDFWLRALASGARHRYLPEALSLHRMSPAQKSAKLAAAYGSDIRLLSDLRHDFPLSEDETLAVEETIRAREAMIARLKRPDVRLRRTLRGFFKRIAVAALGPARARRLRR
jgi:glycosyltransferase involved in cell wall biosynthesis